MSTAILEDVKTARDIAEVKIITQKPCVGCTATLRKFGDYANLTLLPTSEEDKAEEVQALIAATNYSQAPIVAVFDSTGTMIDSWYGFNPDKIQDVLNDSNAN